MSTQTHTHHFPQMGYSDGSSVCECGEFGFMSDPYALTGEQFKTALEALTTPGELLSNAARIYEFMSGLFGTNCADSVMREWAFEWWTDKTGRDYAEIYNLWLNIK